MEFRLVQTRTGVRMAAVVQRAAESYSKKSHSVELVLSNETRDKHGSVITWDGWRNADGDTISFLDSHNYYSIEASLGSMRVRKSAELKALVATATFSQHNPRAVMAEGMVADGSLWQFSVGFEPYRWFDGDGNEHTRVDGDPYPGWLSSEKGFKYVDQEAGEGSIVVAASNPDANALASPEPEWREEIRELREEIRGLLAARQVIETEHQFTTDWTEPRSDRGLDWR